MQASLRPIRQFAAFLAVIGGALALTACLVSENPLLDASNARGKPLKPGQYQSCPYEDGKPADDCAALDISQEGGLYRFQPLEENETPTLVRFRALGAGGFLAQMWGEDDRGYWYFYAEKAKGALQMMMIDCQSLPASHRDSLVARGDLALEDDGKTCVGKTLAGAENAAKAYRGVNAVKPDEVLVISKAPAQ